MKTLINFLANIFGIGSAAVITTDKSQDYVLKSRMEQKQMTHGETVKADLSKVHVKKSLDGETVLFFCPMERIKITEKICDGDGGKLPTKAIIENLKFPRNKKSGHYNLKNVMITSNGTLQVHATANTEWELV